MSEARIVDRSPLQEYHWYMAGQALYFFAGGIGFVLNQWLITFYLKSTPEVVGLAQMVNSLPQLCLILVGGMAADRLELRGHLIRLQLIAAIPILLLATVIFTGYLSVVAVVSISVLGGILGAFVQPARDSLLTRVTLRLEDRSIQQTVTIANMLQFGAQIFGILLVSLVATIGPIPLILTQAGLTVSAAFAMKRISPSPPENDSSNTSVRGLLHEIQDGLRESFASDQIRPIMFWLGSFGFISMGIYLVVLPLMVRDIYHGGAFEFSAIHVCFFVGVTLASYPLSKFGHFKYQGRMMVFGQCGSLTLIFLMSLGLPLYGFFACIFGWGVIAALSMSMTRSIVQQSAPDTHRARILSVYQLVNFGGGPIGSFIAGFLVRGHGPLFVMKVASLTGLIFVLSFLLFTNIWRMRAPVVVMREDNAPAQS
jgi:MFS family permease